MDDNSVIIIDDDPVIVLVHQVLVKKSRLSSKPVAFATAPEALNYLDTCDHEKNRSLLLLDINMPGMSGWDLLDIINSKPYSTHIFAIIISSSINIKDKKKAKTYRQVIGYLEKPVQLKDLQDFNFIGSFS